MASAGGPRGDAFRACAITGERCRARASRARMPMARVCLSHPAIASLRGELVSFTTHRLDQVETEFGAEAADADVDHVGAGIEVVPPHRREQLPLGHRLPGVLHELTEQEEF